MVTITLVYPFFQPKRDNSIFRFPPLGLGYMASALREHGFSVALVDCTFLNHKQALEQIRRFKPKILGFYSMFSMKQTTMKLAQSLREDCQLLVAGGPLPTLDPEGFLDVFDVVAVGEGEETIVEIANCVEQGLDISGVRGIVYKVNERPVYTAKREFIQNLDTIPFPSRDLFDNHSYKAYYSKKFGYTTTPIISSRGCPFSCDFCSRPVFGQNLRVRSPENIVAEADEVERLGYEQVWFADDCFTLDKTQVLRVCDLILERRLNLGWECLSRVDTMDLDTAIQMKKAGCKRVFFGIESGNDQVLKIMRKCVDVFQARHAVYAAKTAGLEVGAFFIVGYPGENDKTILDTIRFATELPLDYLSFTLPYPIPGTPLYDHIKHISGLSTSNWEENKNWSLIRHKLLCDSGFSERKLKFAIGKAQLQYRCRKYVGETGYNIIGRPFERVTDWAFTKLK
ncbi:MAG: B12-binding domain-containing radical SAM protein [Candidatus Bathyarchaeota archaeon]|nr:B12-binding domain-containing radical SAM protein [Candidatus Termiticorpusculum sp.]